MNYAQLSAAIQEYCQSTETSFVANISTFVKQAEKRIYNMVQFPALRKNVTGTTAANNRYLACPDDFLAPYSLAVILADGSYEYLLNKDVNFIRESYPTPTSTGVPAYYALFGPRSDNAVLTGADAKQCLHNGTPLLLLPRLHCGYGYELAWR